jgi:hypothetical protein
LPFHPSAVKINGIWFCGGDFQWTGGGRIASASTSRRPKCLTRDHDATAPADSRSRADFRPRPASNRQTSTAAGGSGTRRLRRFA